MVTHGSFYTEFEDYKKDDYYVEKNGGGRIFGRVADRLDLSGPLTLEKHRILSSTILEPDKPDATPLVVAGGAKGTHRHGDDYTFAPDKTVSIAWAFGTPTERREIAAAHEKAVLAAARYIEDNMMTYKKTVGWETVSLNTGGAAMSMIHHHCSRQVKEDIQPDMHLHTHLLIYNIVWVEGIGWKAVENYKLVTNLNGLINQIYNNELKLELMKLGYHTSQDAKGNVVLDEISPEVKNIFCKRHAVVVAKGATYKTDYRTRKDANELAAKTTRLGKENREWELMREDWESQVLAAGRYVLECSPARSPENREMWARVTAATMISQAEVVAADGFKKAEKIGVFTKEDVMKCALKKPGYMVTVDRLEAAVDTILEKNKNLYRIGDVIGKKNKVDVIYTTEEAIKAERGIIDRARQYREVDVQLVPMFWAKNRELSKDQHSAVRDMLRGKKLTLVQGDAGTGKTTALKEFAAQVGTDDLIMLAPTNIAARAAADAVGGVGRSVHSFLGLDKEKEEKYTPLNSKDKIIIIDECSMLDNDLMKRVLEKCADAKKIIMMGDHKQLNPIDAGEPWSLLLEFCGGEKRLTEIKRQTTLDYNLAMRTLSRGVEKRSPELIQKSFKRLENVKEQPGDKEGKDWFNDGNVAELLAARVQDYAGETYICPKNSTRVEINNMIRQVRIDRGELSATGMDVVLDKSHTPGEEQDEIRRFAVGDRVISLATDMRRGLCNGSIGTVTAIDQQSGHLTLFDERDKTEKVVYTRDFPHLEHAYAITGHKSQSASIDHTVAVLDTADGMIDAQMVYTVFTRGQRKMEIITDDRNALLKKTFNFSKPRSAIKVMEKAKQDEKILNNEMSMQKKMDPWDRGMGMGM